VALAAVFLAEEPYPVQLLGGGVVLLALLATVLLQRSPGAAPTAGDAPELV
jgi:drug/metabolite transporter (DMT)-like permease